jgi:predicted DNA-binding protein
MQSPGLAVPRKDERITIPLDKETLERLQTLADVDGRPTGQLAASLVKAAIELLDKHDFYLIQGKLRRAELIENYDIKDSEASR